MPILLFFALLCLSACKPALLEPEVKASAEGFQEVLIAGAAEPGYRDGPAQQAQFSGIADLTFDTEGGVYLLDSFNNVLRYLSPQGQVETLAGQVYSHIDANDEIACRYRDGAFEDAYFCGMRSITALHSIKALFLSESSVGSRNRAIRKIDLQSKQVKSIDITSNQYKEVISTTPYPFIHEDKLSDFLIYGLGSDNQSMNIYVSAKPYSRIISLQEQRINLLQKPDLNPLIYYSSPLHEGWMLHWLSDYQLVRLDQSYAIDKVIGQSGTPEQRAFHCVDFPGPDWTCSGGYQDGPLDQALFHDISSMAFSPCGRYIFLISKSQPHMLDDTDESNVLRRIDLQQQTVETVVSLPKVRKIYISPQGAFYFVRQHQLYQLKPSPAEVTE